MTKEEIQKRREEIIFGQEGENYEHGGIKSFNSLNVTQLGRLISEQLIDPDDAQNDSPTAKEFFDFGVKWNCLFSVEYNGYVVSKKRPDCRVSIEGIDVYADQGSETFSPQFMIDFVNVFRHADAFDLTIDKAGAWFD